MKNTMFNLQEVVRMQAEGTASLLDLRLLMEDLMELIQLRQELAGSVPILLCRHKHDALRADANWTAETTAVEYWPYEGRLIKIRKREGAE